MVQPFAAGRWLNSDPRQQGGGVLSYYFAKQLALPFDEAVAVTTENLKQEGFGVLTEIDVKATLKKKLDIEFPRYRILGACNPPFAHQALQAEPHIGLMLPCNVIVREAGAGVEVAAIDPVASMQAVDNLQLGRIADQVRQKLQKVIASLP
jgi:uncharacterized protein (DUF302 family)